MTKSKQGKQKSPKQNNSFKHSNKNPELQNMETSAISPPYSQENKGYMPPPPPYHQLPNVVPTGSTDLLRQTSEVLYGQYNQQQINVDTNTGPSSLTNVNAVNNTMNNNAVNSGCVSSNQPGQMQQISNYMPVQAPQQNGQQTTTNNP